MNRDGVISLADAPGCPAAVTAFYDRYWERILALRQWSRGTAFWQICSKTQNAEQFKTGREETCKGEAAAKRYYSRNGLSLSDQRM